MSTGRTHHVTTTDGVTVGGTVHGSGPPLVFLQGVIGDGDLDWQALLPHLTDRFTCHLPSMRGRGLSGDSPDVSVGRIVDDYVDYVESIGEPAGLVGWSAGANHALAVAARSDAVTSVAPFEPVADSQMDDRELAALGGAVARTGELAARGEPAAAMRAFAGFPLADDEVAAAEDAGYFEAAARYVPHLLEVFRQLAEYTGPMPEDPAVLGAVRAPVAVILGSRTKPFFGVSARHVAEHVRDGRVQEVPGAGHAAPLSHPGALAAALSDVFAPTPHPA